MELVLNSFGISLSKDNDGFLVSGPECRQHIPTQGVDSIRIAQGAKITSDAVLLAIANEIDVLFVDKEGKPMGRVWSPKYGSISTIRKGQICFSSSKQAVDWIKEIIVSKIENQQSLIQMLQCENEHRMTVGRSTVSQLEYIRNKVMQVEGDYVRDIASTLRGLEGAASRSFFKAYSQFLPEPFRFDGRSQHPAMDMTNAMLNYGYGVLYGKVEGALISAGVDPYVGVLHRDEYNRPVLVYDVIELYRVWVEYVSFRILESGAVSEEFFSRQDDGSVWLENMGRRVLIQSLNDYLEEIVTDGTKSRMRATMIELYAQSLAQKFKTYTQLC